MSVHRQQAHLDAPVEEVWSLVGSPGRYPEWWPRVIEVRGERFEEGDQYVQVTRDPSGTVESNFLIDRARDLREIRMSCQLTGTYAHWLLTPAQGGTFVELEMGMEPRGLGHRLFDLTMGKRYFRSWSEQSLDACKTRRAASVAARPPGPRPNDLRAKPAAAAASRAGVAVYWRDQHLRARPVELGDPHD